jgi:phi13 family phage major tail protein
MTKNYKSVKGIDKIYYARVTQDDSGAYVAGTPAYFAPAMTITQSPTVNTKTQYADNQPFDTSTSKGETKVECEITDLPLDVKAEVLGDAFDPASGRHVENGGSPPYIALGFRAKKSDGTFRYFWYLKGQFAPPSEEAATETDTPDPKSAKLTFTAIRTTHQFAHKNADGDTITDSVKRVTGDSSDANFDGSTWFDAVQTPVVGAVSALSCTPSPADGASGQATSTAPTLTFNNALRTGTLGILLTTDAGVVKAANISIDATAKIVTITPNTALASATKYLISLAGVTDIYGQKLVNTVYDFTTA